VQLEEIAADLGVDAAKLRRRNLLRDGDIYATGEVMEGLHFERILDGLESVLGPKVDAPSGTVRRGRGIAITLKTTLTPSRTEARLVVGDDGVVTVHAAATEMGQGATATIMLNVGHELSLEPSKVRRLAIDTDRDPFDTATGSSRTTYSTGVAIREAASDLRGRLDGLATGDASAALEHRDAGLVLPDGTWRSYRDVLLAAGVPEVVGEGVFQSRGGWTPEGQLRDGGPSTAHWHQGGAAVDVEVDLETGRVQVVGAAGAAFAGVALDRTRVDQQNVGCVIMGLGHSLFEESVYDDGQLTNPNLSDYPIPSILDLPEHIGSVVIEDLEHGEVHGVGEMAIPAVPPAVAAAIHDATGVWLHDLPFTPEKVLSALDARGGA
jgi:CO/xanthine dehydrogenase Mo-binding subunit